MQIAELRKLIEGATALPWQAQNPDEIDVFVPIIGVILGDDGVALETPTNGLVGGATLFPTEIDAEDYTRAIANAARIAELEVATSFLLDRLADHENCMSSEEDSRDWHGHVVPAISRARTALERRS